MDHSTVVTDPISYSMAEETKTSVIEPEPTSDVKDQVKDILAQLGKLANSVQGLAESFASQERMLTEHKEATSQQFSEIKASLDNASVEARANTEAVSGSLNEYRRETSRRLGNMQTRVDGIDSRLDIADLVVKEAKLDSLIGRMDNMEATISGLVNRDSIPKSLSDEGRAVESPPTLNAFPTSYPTSTPTRGLTTPVAHSHDERRLSPQNEPMDSMFRMSEIVAQTVAQKLSVQMADTAGKFQEAFEPFGRKLDEVVKSAKKITKESFKTPKAGKPTSKKKDSSGYFSPPGSSSSSSSDNESDGSGSGRSDNGSTKSDSSNSILRGMEFSTRKRYPKSKGEARRMSTLTPPVMKKTKHGGSPTIMYVKAETPSNALQLTKLSVETVTWFVTTFNDMDANTTEDLKMSKFIHTRVRDRMVMYAERVGLPGANGMVDRGRHLLENDEVFTLLAYCVTPKTKMEMTEELKKPVFSVAEQKRIKDELGLMIRPTDYKDYYDHMDEYRRRFIKRLDLFNEFGKRYLPREVFTKHDEWGMADYFIYGMLYRKLGKSIWQGVDTNKKSKAAKGFDRYLEYFFERLKLLKRDAERIEIFNKTMSGAAAERTHSDRGEYEQDQTKKGSSFNRSGRTHHMSRIDEAYDKEYEESPVEDDDDALYDGVIEFDLEDYEDSRSAGDDRKAAAVDDERKPAAEPEPEDDGQEEGFGVGPDGQLMTVQPKRPLTDEEKSKLLCFKFYNTGQCTEPGCKFSHDRQLATKKLREDQARLAASVHNPDRAPTPTKKPVPGPRVSWPDDAVRQSTNPRLTSSGGRGGGRGTSPRVLKRG